MAKEIIQWVLAGLFGGSILIEIVPIKINPWKSLAKWIGKYINGDVIARMDKMETKVDNLEKEMGKMKDADEERDAKNARIRILRFGDEVLHGVEHSKEHFDQILLDITEYNLYCKDHPNFQNDMTVMTTQQIKKSYAHRWEKHDFM